MVKLTPESSPFRDVNRIAELNWAIKNLKRKKAHEKDDIPEDLIKNLWPVARLKLPLIINEKWDFRKFPDRSPLLHCRKKQKYTTKLQNNQHPKFSEQDDRKNGKHKIVEASEREPTARQHIGNVKGVGWGRKKKPTYRRPSSLPCPRNRKRLSGRRKKWHCVHGPDQGNRKGMNVKTALKDT